MDKSVQLVDNYLLYEQQYYHNFTPANGAQPAQSAHNLG